jgi:phosphoribosylanthranilate isomerase
MKSVQIKICGITNVRDAAACAQLGADMIGLNFYPESSRCITVGRAREIVEAFGNRTEPVGVFVDAAAREVRRVTELVGLRAVQLHGRITAGTCRNLAADFRVIRALHTTTQYMPQAAADFPDCDILLDGFHTDLHGGTGALCDWRAARETHQFVRTLILAGGLNAENIAAAIAAVSPDAVDVCSGVERSPGVKDHGALARFVAAVRNAQQFVSA